MLKQVVNDTEVKCLVGSVNFKHVSYLKSNVRKQRTSVLNVARTKVKPAIIQPVRQAIRMEKTVIIRRPARRFQHGHRLSATSRGLNLHDVTLGGIRHPRKSRAPKIAEGVEGVLLNP